MEFFFGWLNLINFGTEGVFSPLNTWRRLLLLVADLHYSVILFVDVKIPRPKYEKISEICQYIQESDG